LLIENPDKMRKLQEEVDSVMSTQLDDSPDGDAPTVASYDQIKSLPYLRAVIDESLRLYPPISHGLPRETPKEGTMIMDQWVSGNTTVSVSEYVAHRDPSVFGRPESFVPERLLGEQGRALQSRFITFSAGARGYWAPDLLSTSQHSSS
jgi:cytochrome P450